MLYHGKRVDGAHYTDARGDLWLAKVRKGKHGSIYALVVWGSDPGDMPDVNDAGLMERIGNDELRDYIVLDDNVVSRVAWWALPPLVRVTSAIKRS